MLSERAGIDVDGIVNAAMLALESSKGKNGPGSSAI